MQTQQSIFSINLPPTARISQPQQTASNVDKANSPSILGVEISVVSPGFTDKVDHALEVIKQRAEAKDFGVRTWAFLSKQELNTLNCAELKALITELRKVTESSKEDPHVVDSIGTTSGNATNLIMARYLDTNRTQTSEMRQAAEYIVSTCSGYGADSASGQDYKDLIMRAGETGHEKLLAIVAEDIRQGKAKQIDDGTASRADLESAIKDAENFASDNGVLTDSIKTSLNTIKSSLDNYSWDKPLLPKRFEKAKLI